MTAPHNIWIVQCDAARGIENDHGVQPALEYLVGEKFLNFLESSETEKNFRAEIPAFVAEIKAIFETWQLAGYLDTAKQSEPFNPDLFCGDPGLSPQQVEDMRKEDIRQCTRNLLLIESAKEWLLDNTKT